MVGSRLYWCFGRRDEGDHVELHSPWRTSPVSVIVRFVVQKRVNKAATMHVCMYKTTKQATSPV